jgi:hypothetical protein
MLEASLKRKEYKRQYYLSNRASIRKRCNDNYHKDRLGVRTRRKEILDEILRSWIGVIPEFAQCQMCEKDIKYMSGHHDTSICFDHRHGGNEAIKGSPIHWLRDNLPTPENIAIWKECDFGILCFSCNRHIPTKDRIQYIHNLNKYMGIK